MPSKVERTYMIEEDLGTAAGSDAEVLRRGKLCARWLHADEEDERAWADFLKAWSPS